MGFPSENLVVNSGTSRRVYLKEGFTAGGKIRKSRGEAMEV
jgi:hypothetical protein